ncbi:hypothetical protein GCM10025869_07970 [Homoserinibacter gongjuensis]|uniref:Uncharacterized protein n=1 Tax=Homoserinibacter gongjuensis TaxID=1162968 RepID=A0ABQ6JPU5_9MICO|nr:hypothetical protein GCM10025869_07970 [Homoserinibacter gongjuensis]
MELVGEVADALAPFPADRGALTRIQGLGHEHVVVDRHRHEPVAHEQRGEHARAEGDPIRAHASGIREQLEGAGAVGVDAAHGGVLEDLDPRIRRRPRELAREPRRVHEGHLATTPGAAEVARRVHLGLHAFAVEEHDVGIRMLGSGCSGEPVELVRLGRHVEFARALPLHVEPEFGDRALHRVEVLEAEASELRVLRGPP